ncbi:MAG TPA: hypothetical protein DCM86_05815, partial [Verrucomicrobiales bacterium]|nr:hypothetical protein [Verrucomicrobiales bacterium]
SGAWVGGVSDNGYNGSFPVDSVDGVDPGKFYYKPNNPVPAAAPDAGSDMSVGRWPSHYIAVDPNLAVGVTATGGPTDWTVTVQTATAHYLKPGDWVNLYVPVASGGPSPYTGRWMISATGTDRKVFTFRYLGSNPGVPYWLGSAFVGVPYQGTGIDGGRDAVMEGCLILNTRVGGPYHDTYASKSISVRNNRYRGVVTGPYQNMGGVASGIVPTGPVGPPPQTGLIHGDGAGGGDPLLATFMTAREHHFSIGQWVKVTQAKVGGVPEPDGSYNGRHRISSIPSPTSFSYVMSVTPAANADVGSGNAAALWQVEELHVERNLIEIIPYINDSGVPTGIRFGGTLPTDFTGCTIYQHVALNGNVIRFIDQRSDAASLGVDASFCETLNVSQNSVSLGAANPILASGSTHVKYFENMKEDGTFLQGSSAGVVQPEVRTVVEEALILALL